MKKYIAYPILFVSTILFVRTLPSFLNNLFLNFNVKLELGFDLSSCKGIFTSIMKDDFCEPLCLLSFLGICLGLVIIMRKRDYGLFKFNYKNRYNILTLFIYFSISSFILIVNVWYFYLALLEWNLLDLHIIYFLSFSFAVLTYLIYFIYFIMIFADIYLHFYFKLVALLVLLIICYYLQVDLLTFISTYNPYNYIEGELLSSLDSIIYSLGLGVFCMEENDPCPKELKNMDFHCGSARSLQNMPPIRTPGKLRAITVLWKNLGLLHEINECKKSRNRYNNCMDIFKSVNNSKRK